LICTTELNKKNNVAAAFHPNSFRPGTLDTRKHMKGIELIKSGVFRKKILRTSGLQNNKEDNEETGR
jgi:hypothetical protein